MVLCVLSQYPKHSLSKLICKSPTVGRAALSEAVRVEKGKQISTPGPRPHSRGRYDTTPLKGFTRSGLVPAEMELTYE
jgi:hypothetical protein